MFLWSIFYFYVTKPFWYSINIWKTSTVNELLPKCINAVFAFKKKKSTGKLLFFHRRMKRQGGFYFFNFEWNRGLPDQSPPPSDSAHLSSGSSAAEIGGPLNHSLRPRAALLAAADPPWPRLPSDSSWSPISCQRNAMKRFSSTFTCTVRRVAEEQILPDVWEEEGAGGGGVASTTYSSSLQTLFSSLSVTYNCDFSVLHLHYFFLLLLYKFKSQAFLCSAALGVDRVEHLVLPDCFNTPHFCPSALPEVCAEQNFRILDLAGHFPR